MTNPDAPLDKQAVELAQVGASEDAIAGATQGFATVFEADDPFCPAGTTLPTLPELPTGFDWRVVLREHRDSTNLTDDGEYDDYAWQGWYWEDGRPICGHKKAIIFLRQNEVVLKQRTVEVEGLDTEFEFVTKIVDEAKHLFDEHDFDRRDWLAADFPGLQEQ